jgi:hypothetical protein
MTKLQLDLWANEQGMFASLLMIISSIIGAAGKFLF